MRTPAYNMGIATSATWRCINGHFIAINISRAGQALLGFCLLTCTFISLLGSGSGQDKQWIPPLQQYLFVIRHAVWELLHFELLTKIYWQIPREDLSESPHRLDKRNSTFSFCFLAFVLFSSSVLGGLLLKSLYHRRHNILVETFQETENLLIRITYYEQGNFDTLLLFKIITI